MLDIPKDINIKNNFMIQKYKIDLDIIDYLENL